MEESKTFCIYPWIYMMVSTTGDLRPCCLSSRYHLHDGKYKMVVPKYRIEEAFNGQEMVDMRQAMLSGQPVSGCEICYNQEKIGKKSYRQHNNDEWKRLLGKEYNHIILESIKNGAKVESPIRYLDLRIGNHCNLSCRSCHPCNSVSVERDWIKADTFTDGRFSQLIAKNNLSSTKIAPWYQDGQFWKEVDRLLPKLKKIYLTGGEPTLIANNFRLLKQCVELGYSQDIILFLNLNMTVLPEHYLELFKHFKLVQISMSIDGTGNIGEYIRGGSSWEGVIGNIQRLLSTPGDNIKIGISSVIQIYNIMSLSSLIDYFYAMGKRFNKTIAFDFLYCTTPDFLDVKILPRSIKRKAMCQLYLLAIRYSVKVFFDYRHFPTLQNIQSLYRYLKLHRAVCNKEKLEEFMLFTRGLDAVQGKSFYDIFPVLAKSIEREILS